jgi:exonuclease VII small subunit
MTDITTKTLEENKKRLEEIANEFQKQEVSLDDILPRTDEALAIKELLNARLNAISNALNEKLKKEQ